MHTCGVNKNKLPFVDEVGDVNVEIYDVDGMPRPEYTIVSNPRERELDGLPLLFASLAVPTPQEQFNIAVGTRVVLCNLKAEHMNGTVGVIEGEVGLDSGRYSVSIEGDDANKSIKPENLRVDRDTSIVPFDLFKKRFAKTTGGVFARWTADTWNNIVVAGGCILSCLTPGEEAPSSNSDVDLFIYGLGDAEARQKIMAIFEIVSASPCCQGSESKRCLALRTPNTLTFVLPLPVRHVQVILRLHAGKDDVIQAFDVDCCGFMFDGEAVTATTRAARAIRTKTNVVVAERRSWTYEQRVLKYVRRGYSVAVPGLDVPNVNLRKKYAITAYRSRLPEDHPQYLEGSYQRIVTGVKYQFENEWRDTWRTGDTQTKPDVKDYFESSGLRKLLIAAHGGGVEVFRPRGAWFQRGKFLMSSSSTMEIAGFMMACGEHYGPSLPYVPGVRQLPSPLSHST